MPFTIVIEKRALKDIQNAIDYYDEQAAGLGKKFNSAISKHIATIADKSLLSIKIQRLQSLTD